MKVFLDAGVKGFGLGSGLFKPGMSVADVTERAQAYVAALEAAQRSACRLSGAVDAAVQ